MTVRIGRRIIVGAALATPFIRTARADAIKLRVSVDTGPAHGRTRSIADFLQKLVAASQGEIAPQLLDSGQRFADVDVIKALVMGEIDMAAPGTWIVAAYVPEADLVQLPLFYGQPAEFTHRAIDGLPGDIVNERISKKLRVTVPGHWIDLGFVNWYSAHAPLNGLADLKGLKVRNGGGFGQSWRAQFFGGVPNRTAWPDVPLALAQGTFDALQTTDESCASARLWDAGLHFGLIDHQTLVAYIPMISQSFWAALSPALKSLMTDLWAANIGIYRSNLATDQERAGKELRAHGVRLNHVPAEEIAAQRKLMLADQDKVAQEMRISADMVARVSQAVDPIN